MSLGVRRVALAGVTAVAVLGVTAAPSSAMSEDECLQQATDVGDTCVDDENGNYSVVNTGDPFASDDLGSGIPGWFGFLFFLVIVLGIATTIWRVSTARKLATEAGMDPDVATGMTLLDDDGLSTTYLASSLRTSPRATPPVAAPLPPSAESRLTELKRLLENGLVTQAEYDERRKAIIDAL